MSLTFYPGIKAVILISLGEFPNCSEHLAVHNLKCTFSDRTHAYIGSHFNILSPVLTVFYFSASVCFYSSEDIRTLADADVTRVQGKVPKTTVKENRCPKSSRKLAVTPPGTE